MEQKDNALHNILIPRKSEQKQNVQQMTTKVGQWDC